MEAEMRVLILDDEPLVGERLKPSLERAGFQVDVCTSSHQALQMLGNVNYNFLVTDLKMSGTDGMEVLRRARKIHPQIKVVVITGFATKETFDEAMKSGAVEFLAKPFKMCQLRDLLIHISQSAENLKKR